MVTDLLDDESLLDLRGRAKATDPAAVLAEERGRRTAAPAPASDLPLPGTGRPATGAEAATCAICRTRPTRDQCTLCGRGVCAADLWIMLRLCRACADERAVERGQRGGRPEPANWLAGEGRA